MNREWIQTSIAADDNGESMNENLNDSQSE